MTPYSIGTLVKIEKLDTLSGAVDASKENLYGYITDNCTVRASGNNYYVVYLFHTGRKHNLLHHHIAPV